MQTTPPQQTRTYRQAFRLAQGVPVPGREAPGEIPAFLLWPGVLLLVVALAAMPVAFGIEVLWRLQPPQAGSPTIPLVQTLCPALQAPTWFLHQRVLVAGCQLTIAGSVLFAGYIWVLGALRRWQSREPCRRSARPW